MTSPYLPILYACIGAFLGGLMTFGFNMLFRRQGRRLEQDDELERWRQRCEQRLEIAELKIGMIYRGIEDHVAELLLPKRER